MLPEKFTKKQQIQSRLDGGLELDGSRRQLLATTSQELPGHHVREHSRAHAEQRPPLSCHSQVSLQGCHQSLMPTYRLPQSVCNVISLDEVGMTSDTVRVVVPAKPLRWCTDEESVLEWTVAPNTVQTEFHGGEGIDADEPEDELVDAAERSSPVSEP